MMEVIIKKTINDHHKKQRIAHADKAWNKFLASSEIDKILAHQRAENINHNHHQNTTRSSW